ncbi:sensitized chromosome inheritance modifier [Elysia marginata]|uniref:Protein MCM10 homolog n=1 Tax=Elysia marginata TaxID=1093978 RepID=A0AAV4F0L6_9GAST|nr:sensitized chromosome inheritance modifier [Elysia marginata]
MDNREASDEECLDLEALEALLDKDDSEDGIDYDDNQELLDATETLEKGSKESEAKSLEDFFDAASDSDEEEEGLNQSSLKSFNPSSRNTDTGKEKNADDSLRNSSKMCRSSHPKPTSDDKRNKPRSDPARPLPSAQSSVDPTTAAIRQEMAEMQKRMEALHKLLENRSPTASVQGISNLQGVDDLCRSLGKKQSEDNKTSIKPNSTSKKIFQEQLGKLPKDKKPEFRLMDETGDSPFFDASSASTTSASRDVNVKIKKEGTVMQKKLTNQQMESTPKDKKKTMERELFGDSDSDWDELDGEDKQRLSEAGQELKRIMKLKEKGRVAHKPKFGTPDLSQGASQTWARFYSEQEADPGRKKQQPQKLVKNTLQCKSSSDQSKPKDSGVEEEPSLTEAYSKIRIVNPLISHSLMKMRMEGRKMISIPRIHLKMKTQEVQGDWVTIGVIVNKSEAKTSSAGKPYSIWRLNDLEDLDNSVSFFLFGEKHKQLWKTEPGTVIGVLNPGMMDALEKNSSEPAFTVQNVNQVMIMGRSKDLAWCTALTKGGNKCCKFINRRQGDFCAFHVQAAYRKQSAQRLELHGSINGVRPRSFESKIFSKDCAYMYAGQTFVPNSRADSGKSKKGVTLSKLQNSMTEGRYQKVNTLSINEIKPQHVGVSAHNNGRIKEDSNDTFLDMIAVPSAGSMNFVAHLKSQNNKATSSGGGSGGSGLATGVSGSVQSVSAKDLMKMHKQDMERKRQAQKLQRSPLNRPDPLQLQPQLGKGLGQKGEVLLDVGKTAGKADFAKLKAIAAIKQVGGIEKQDPNAIKKSGDKVKEKVKRRVEEDCGSSSSSSSPDPTKKHDRDREQESSSRSPRPGKPPKKKSKLLGDVDLNSAEVKAILKAKSKHKGVLAEAEAEREEAYFAELEKKEMLEEKMQSVTSIEITVVTCKLCMYTAQSAKDSCKKEGHTLKRSKAKKRFFKCKKCKHRTFVIDAKFPTRPCSKCGEMSYEKTSMCPIRSGPKLDSEVLIHRGDEVKNLNSLDQKVYLNTVIDD